MSEHKQKWNEVCQELNKKHPNSDVTLWVNGYVFGLNHAASMELDLDNFASLATRKLTMSHSSHQGTDEPPAPSRDEGNP